MRTWDARRWRMVAVGILGAEALGVAGLAVVAASQIAFGPSSAIKNNLMLAAILVVTAVGLGLLGRSLVRGRTSGLTLALVWHALLALAVGSGLWQNGQQPWSVAVCLLAGVAALACVLATTKTDPSSDR